MTADSRTRRSASNPSESRSDRSATADVERERDASGLSRSEMNRLLRDEFKQEALPSAPPMPGWHTCWLAVNNSYDPIHKRMRLGYQPVRAEEVPELAAFRMATGEYEGVVGCNEMVLFKVPQERYMQIMNEYHHDAPMREEEALKAQLRRGERDSEGKDLEQIEGFDDIAVARQTPFFA